MTRISSIRMLIALASVHNLLIHHMNVKTAFLNGGLEKEIYMVQLEGCMVPGEDKRLQTNKLFSNIIGEIYWRSPINRCPTPPFTLHLP